MPPQCAPPRHREGRPAAAPPPANHRPRVPHHPPPLRPPPHPSPPPSNGFTGPNRGCVGIFGVGSKGGVPFLRPSRPPYCAELLARVRVRSMPGTRVRPVFDHVFFGLACTLNGGSRATQIDKRMCRQDRTEKKSVTQVLSTTRTTTPIIQIVLNSFLRNWLEGLTQNQANAPHIWALLWDRSRRPNLSLHGCIWYPPSRETDGGIPCFFVLATNSSKIDISVINSERIVDRKKAYITLLSLLSVAFQHNLLRGLFPCSSRDISPNHPKKWPKCPTPNGNRSRNGPKTRQY